MNREQHPRISKLYPEHLSGIDIKDIHADLKSLRGWGEPRGSGRPWVMVNMVSSVDGKAQVSGVATGLGGTVDRTVMRTLRAQADAVMIGAGTLRSEKLSLGLDAVDFDRQPVGVIVSSSATGLPTDNLTSLGRQKVLVVTTGPPSDPTPLGVEFLRVPATASGTVDLDAAMKKLKKEEGVEVVLAEGGPSINTSLFSMGLVDELFLTVAPKLLGPAGGATIITPEQGTQHRGAPGNAPQNLRLLSQFLAGNELFLRYAVETSR